MMKKATLIAIGLTLCGPFVFAQSVKITTVQATRATKTIEHNFVKSTPTEKVYNLGSKSQLEKRFFGDVNAPVEFFAVPSFDGAYGLRIFQDPLTNAWIFESKRVLNWKEVDSKINQEYPYPIIQVALSQGLGEEEWRQMNRAIFDKRQEESAKLYQIKTVSFPIYDSLATKLYAQIFIALANSPKEVKGGIVKDGTFTTFRCVNGDEMWTLKYHQPDEGDFLKLTNICTRMIEDASSGTFDAQKYLKLLDE